MVCPWGRGGGVGPPGVNFLRIFPTFLNSDRMVFSMALGRGGSQGVELYPYHIFRIGMVRGGFIHIIYSE